MKIKGRIIRIIDRRTVVINLGEKHGIDNSSIFYILGEPEEIKDPYTDEILGTVNVTKIKVKASQVFDKFTVATTSWTNIHYPSIFLSGILKVGELAQTQTIDEGELKVKEDEIQPWKARSESPVKVGDEVEVEVNIKDSSEYEEQDTEEMKELESENKS